PSSSASCTTYRLSGKKRARASPATRATPAVLTLTCRGSRRAYIHTNAIAPTSTAPPCTLRRHVSRHSVSRISDTLPGRGVLACLGVPCIAIPTAPCRTPPPSRRPRQPVPPRAPPYRHVAVPRPAPAHPFLDPHRPLPLGARPGNRAPPYRPVGRQQRIVHVH